MFYVVFLDTTITNDFSRQMQESINMNSSIEIVDIIERIINQVLNKEKYNCTADLQFDWFGLSQASKYVANIVQKSC